MVVELISALQLSIAPLSVSNFGLGIQPIFQLSRSETLLAELSAILRIARPKSRRVLQRSSYRTWPTLQRARLELRRVYRTRRHVRTCPIKSQAIWRSQSKARLPLSLVLALVSVFHRCHSLFEPSQMPLHQLPLSLIECR